MPAPTERSTSATVWSRCRSTKQRSQLCEPSSTRGTSHSGRVALTGVGAASGTCGCAANPASCAAAAPARAPSARQPARSSVPFTAPAVCWSRTGPAGTNPASSSSQRSLPCRWLCRCTTGLQPPETASRSAASVSRGPVGAASSSRPVITTPLTRPPSPQPSVPITALPVRTGTPVPRVTRSARSVSSGRESTTAATSTPAATRSATSSYAESLVVATTARRPAATPYRLR